MRKIIKNVLSEAMGVPNNIVNVAHEIYKKVIDSIDDDMTFEDLDGYNIDLNGDYDIADLTIKKIEINFDIREGDEIVIAGMATPDDFEVTKKYNIKSTQPKKEFKVQFVIVAPENVTGSDIKKLMYDDRIEFVSSISHELKHKYDSFKKPKRTMKYRSEYLTYTKNNFATITPLNNFLHNLYYTHMIENLVRPSEFAGAIDAAGITKKEFYNFLMDNRTYKRLVEIRDFTYDKLREDLKNDMSKILEAFRINNIEYLGLSEDQIIDKTLQLFFINIKNWKVEMFHKMLSTNFIESLMGFSSEKDRFFRKYIKNLEKFDDNYKKYFEYEEKMFNFVAIKMIKKIGKLYDMTKNVKTESIINWELWQKIKGENSKIVTELKYPTLKVQKQTTKPKKPSK
jgi:hypothetical protein